MIFDNIENKNKISIDKIKKEISVYNQQKKELDVADNELMIKYVEKYETPRIQQEEEIQKYLEERGILYDKWKIENSKQSLLDLISLERPEIKKIPEIYSYKLLGLRNINKKIIQKEAKQSLSDIEVNPNIFNKPKNNQDIINKPEITIKDKDKLNEQIKIDKEKFKQQIKDKIAEKLKDKPKDIPKDNKEKPKKEPKKTKKDIIQDKDDINTNIGLVNLGNTCYINSALQLLFHYDKINNIILKSNSTDKLIKEYIYLYNSYLNKKVDGVCIENLIKELNNKITNENDKIIIGRQSDSSEFLIKLITTIQEILNNKELNKILKIITSVNIILEPIKKYNKEYKCEDIKEEIREEDNGIIIQYDKKTVDISTELQKRFNGTEETIKSKGDLYKCEKTSIDGKIANKEVLFPFIMRRKIIEYPDALKVNINIFNYSNGSGDKIFMNMKIPNKIENKENKYIIKGIICHIGDSLSSGHYIYLSYENYKWYNYSDIDVIRNVNNLKNKKTYYKLDEDVNGINEFNTNKGIPTPYVILYDKQ